MQSLTSLDTIYSFLKELSCPSVRPSGGAAAELSTLLSTQSTELTLRRTLGSLSASTLRYFCWV